MHNIIILQHPPIKEYNEIINTLKNAFDLSSINFAADPKLKEYYTKKKEVLQHQNDYVEENAWKMRFPGGCLFRHYPLDKQQLEWFEKYLNKYNRRIDAIINVNVDTKLIKKKLQKVKHSEIVDIYENEMQKMKDIYAKEYPRIYREVEGNDFDENVASYIIHTLEHFTDLTFPTTHLHHQINKTNNYEIY